MPFWSIPRVWEGATCFIIGGGPSLADVDLSLIEKRKSIAINNSYEVAPWADVLYFMDCVWFNWHEEKIFNFPGLIVSQCLHTEKVSWIKTVHMGKQTEYDERDSWLSRGSNSGHGAICLAARMGAKKIVLLGFDMHSKAGHNWHNNHKRTVAEDIYETKYFKDFDWLKLELDKRGVEVVNATPGSALPAFPIVELEDVL